MRKLRQMRKWEKWEKWENEKMKKWENEKMRKLNLLSKKLCVRSHLFLCQWKVLIPTISSLSLPRNVASQSFSETTRFLARTKWFIHPWIDKGLKGNILKDNVGRTLEFTCSVPLMYSTWSVGRRIELQGRSSWRRARG